MDACHLASDLQWVITSISSMAGDLFDFTRHHELYGQRSKYPRNARECGASLRVWYKAREGPRFSRIQRMGANRGGIVVANPTHDRNPRQAPSEKSGEPL